DDGCSAEQLPTFALQTLLENAVVHGIAPHSGPSRIDVTIKRLGQSYMIAVSDSGEGMSRAALRSARHPDSQIVHGLQILDQQLCILYGRGARLHIFSREYSGTIVAFRIPSQVRSLGSTHAKLALSGHRG